MWVTLLPVLSVRRLWPRREVLERLAVPVRAAADDPVGGELRDDRDPPPRLAFLDVRDVHLDERPTEELERVADRPAVVRPRARVDDQPVDGADGVVAEPDVLALAVR